MALLLLIFPLPLNNFVPNGKFNMVLGFLIIPKVKLVERAHKQLQEQIDRWGGVVHVSLSKAHPQHLINMALFTLNFLKIDDKGNTAAHKHWAPLLGPTRLPLVAWKDVVTGKCQSPAPLLNHWERFPVYFSRKWTSAHLDPRLSPQTWTAETSNEADKIGQL